MHDIFVQFFCVHFISLNISSASVRSVLISVLYRGPVCMKCSLGILIFLKRSPVFSHSVVFAYFFVIFEEGFLMSLCYSLNPVFRAFMSFLFSLLFALFFHIEPIAHIEQD